MRLCRPVTRLPALRSAEGGNVAMITAFVIPCILALTGIAIDLQNTVRQKSKVQAALDSAVLAGALGRQAGNTAAETTLDVQTYALALFTDQGGGLDCDPVAVTFDETNLDILGTVRCRQPTYLSSLIGHDELEFNVASTSTYGVGKLDVAFIFDVSGSMNSYNRLAQLKTAAVAAVDELLPDSRERDGTVRLAIASYNHSLNAGAYIGAVTETVTLSADGSNSTALSRYNSHNTKRMIDQDSGKRFFYYQSGTCSSWNCGKYSSWSWDTKRRFFDDTGLADACVYERTGTQAATDAAPGSGAWIGAGNPRWSFYAGSSSKYDGWQNVENQNATGYGVGAYEGRHGTCMPSGPVPLTEDKTVLKDHVNALVAEGGTAGHLGIAWGWYLVSPEWAAIWPEASEPLPYRQPQTSKAVILMTDGDFNIEHPTASRDSFRQSMDLCDGMKASSRRIQIYTVGFQVPSSVQRTGDGRTILEYCATSPSHAFSADSGEELIEVYRSIARSISDLRLKE
ncbi:TadE/TadG family type IV pilus assembly protein [Hyphomonas neptunium]|nr:pilus assembly protein TadG-related protein [Hyphomonas neptunium]